MRDLRRMAGSEVFQGIDVQGPTRGRHSRRRSRRYVRLQPRNQETEAKRETDQQADKGFLHGLLHSLTRSCTNDDQIREKSLTLLPGGIRKRVQAGVMGR